MCCLDLKKGHNFLPKGNGEQQISQREEQDACRVLAKAQKNTAIIASSKVKLARYGMAAGRAADPTIRTC